jgi:hypothetical protein
MRHDLTLLAGLIGAAFLLGCKEPIEPDMHPVSERRKPSQAWLHPQPNSRLRITTWQNRPMTRTRPGRYPKHISQPR